MDALNHLENYIRRLEKVLVAFSGGVDSALLAYVARQVLGSKNMIAVTGDSASQPSGERLFVKEFCQKYDIPHQFIQTKEYENPNYRANPENRCFFCKEELYLRLKEVASHFGFKNILDGTNRTDLKGHRPGYEALKKAEVVAPYVELKFTKQTVRDIAQFLNLEVFCKPQSACLASRIPTGTPIEIESLQAVDAAENVLKDLGIKNPRVRFHGELARLELKKEEWALCLELRKEIQSKFKDLNFKFVVLDLKEYDREG